MFLKRWENKFWSDLNGVAWILFGERAVYVTNQLDLLPDDDYLNEKKYLGEDRSNP
jgi:hypothetical protein